MRGSDEVCGSDRWDNMTGDWSIKELSSRRPRPNPSDRLPSRLTEGSTQGAPLPAIWPVDGAAASIALSLTAAPRVGCAQLTD